MNILKAYKLSWRQVIRFMRMNGLLYVLNVLFAFATAFPLVKYMGSKLSRTLASLDLMKDFDFALISDFLSNYGMGLGPILDQSFIVLILYLIFSIFVVGGIVYALKDERVSISNFWSGATMYFYKNAGLVIFFLVLHLILILIFWFIFLNLAKGLAPENLRSEVTIVNALYWSIIPYFIFATMIATLQDYAKIILINDNLKVFPTIKKTFVFAKSNFRKMWSLFWLNLITLAICFLIYKLVDLNIDVTSYATMFCFFIAAQFFIFMRIFVKTLHLSGAGYLYREIEDVG